MTSRPTASSIAEIGLSIKIIGSAPDVFKDCWYDRSRIRPRINANTERSRRETIPCAEKYPKTPKATIISTSKTEFLML